MISTFSLSFTPTLGFPDIALEHFHNKPGTLRDGVFVTQDIYEYKACLSDVDPFIQLHKATPLQYGVLHYSKWT